MIFKLIAFLFLMSAPEEPVASMNYNQGTFPGREECEKFVESGNPAIVSLAKAAADRQMIVKFACVKTEDNTI